MNIKTLLIEGSCSPVNCFHRVISELSLCQQLKSCMRHSDLVDPHNVFVSKFITDLMASVEAFKYRTLYSLIYSTD